MARRPTYRLAFVPSDLVPLLRPIQQGTLWPLRVLHSLALRCFKNQGKAVACGITTDEEAITITAVAAVAVMAFAVSASAADRSPGRGGSGSPSTPALPPGVDVSQWPTYLKGNVTGSTHDFSNSVPAGAVGNSCDFSSVEYVGACVPVPDTGQPGQDHHYELANPQPEPEA